MNGHSVTSDNYMGATGVRCLKCGAGMVAERCPETLGCHGRTKGTCPTGWQTCRRLRCPECEPEGEAPESAGPKCCQCGKELTLITSGTQPAYRRGDNPKGWYSDGRDNWWTCLACYPERKPAPVAPLAHTSGYTQRCPQCETVVAPQDGRYVCPQCNAGWGLPSPACAGCTGEECGEGNIITRDAEKCTGWRPNAKARIDLAAGFPSRRWVSSADSPSPPTPCPEREIAGPKCDKCATPMANVCCPGLAVDGKCEKWVTHPDECPEGWPKRNGRGLCNYHYCPKCEPEIKGDGAKDATPAGDRIDHDERMKRIRSLMAGATIEHSDRYGYILKAPGYWEVGGDGLLSGVGKWAPTPEEASAKVWAMMTRDGVWVTPEGNDERRRCYQWNGEKWVLLPPTPCPECERLRGEAREAVANLGAYKRDTADAQDRLNAECERLRNTLRAVARGLDLPEDTDPSVIVRVAAFVEASLVVRVRETKAMVALPPGYVVARAEDVMGGGRR